MTSGQLDQLAINTIRTLSIDAVHQAKSGHPGTPMALTHRSSTLSGTESGASTRRIRFGPIVLGSGSRTATPRCCSGPRSIWPVCRR
jgi:hypothetical protein